MEEEKKETGTEHENSEQCSRLAASFCYPVFLNCGGPIHKIQVNGKVYEFEMHPYCGPTILNKKGSPASVQPSDFLMAASLWAQQGQRTEAGLCRWDYPPEPILKHMAGKHYRVVGMTDVRRGG